MLVYAAVRESVVVIGGTLGRATWLYK
jgi:hypothetical protein